MACVQRKNCCGVDKANGNYETLDECRNHCFYQEGDESEYPPCKGRFPDFCEVSCDIGFLGMTFMYDEEKEKCVGVRTCCTHLNPKNAFQSLSKCQSVCHKK